MNLWIFGDSLSMPFNLEDEDDGWPLLISKHIGATCFNFANPGSDNFLIYHLYKNSLSKILEDDIVIIGWTHYSRKTFVLDRNNPAHMSDIEKSLVYKSGNDELFRANNVIPASVEKWSSFAPLKKTDKLFFDQWFKNYYSTVEQKYHLEAYHHAVKSTVPCKYIPFHFSEESIENTNLDGPTVLEFILKNNVQISQSDSHLNKQGHKLWAEVILKGLNTL